MTLRHLKTFIAVCEHGGITKAADALHIAQPAVSQTIAEIEKYYNVILFDRINQRLILTYYGKQLLVKAKETVASFNDFESLANENNLNAKIRIGSSLTIGKEYIPKIVALIKDNYPQIQVSVIIDSTAVIEEQLTNGNLDFAFVEGVVHSDSLKKQIISRDNLTVVCGAAFSIPQRISLKEFTEYPILLREHGSASRNLLDSVLSANGMTITPVIESASNHALIACAEHIESASNHALIACAEHNIGIAVLPQRLVDDPIENNRLKVIEVDDNSFERYYYLVHHKNKRFSQSQKKIISTALTVF